MCSEAVYEVDREMQNIYKGKQAEYEEAEPESPAEPYMPAAHAQGLLWKKITPDPRSGVIFYRKKL